MIMFPNILFIINSIHLIYNTLYTRYFVFLYIIDNPINIFQRYSANSPQADVTVLKDTVEKMANAYVDMSTKFEMMQRSMEGLKGVVEALDSSSRSSSSNGSGSKKNLLQLDEEADEYEVSGNFNLKHRRTNP